MVTNQPDIARGTQTRAVVDEINAAIGAALPVDEFVVCPHDNAANCTCRKPKPGMVLEAAARHGVDLTASFLIGDRWRDIDCGAAAGVRTVLIDRGYRERMPEHAPDFVAESLAGAAEWILNGPRTDRTPMNADNTKSIAVVVLATLSAFIGGHSYRLLRREL